MDKAALLRQSRLALAGLDSLEQLECLESDTSALGIDSQLIQYVQDHAGGAETELEGETSNRQYIFNIHADTFISC